MHRHLIDALLFDFDLIQKTFWVRLALDALLMDMAFKR